MIQKFDVIVLGAGAAGLMCAIEAGKRGRRVAVLERSDRVGKKILISGGGRCNFTNIDCAAKNFLSANPHFCKSALARYPPSDFIALVERHGIRYHEKHKGQLFCDGSAREIVAMLEAECRRAGVQIVVDARVGEVRQADEFRLLCRETEYRGHTLVVATGGLSIPKIGATAFGYEMAKQFGLKIQPCRPGLVPLLFNTEDRAHYNDLSGLSAEVVAACGAQEFRDKMLITHRGLSGPAILQISSYWDQKSPIVIDLAPGVEWTESVRQSHARRDLAAAKTVLRGFLPHRLADRWLELHPAKDWTNHSLDAMERALHRWEVDPSGTEGYEKAEVTLGGVDTNELSAKTMESRRVPGLFFVGEVVDMTGHLGGFNFQWAWASGFCAGQVA